MTSVSASPEELRLALCMRGGVSLAVWMGGACREIGTLCGAPPVPAAGPAAVATDMTDQRAAYRLLLSRAGYTDVTLDVLAGTSAGGLNGMLLAVHLLYGMEFGVGVRDTWLRIGDLESLIRSPAQRTPPSLLLGDEGFFARLRDQVGSLLAASATPPGWEAQRFLRLILTATRLRPRESLVWPSVGDAFPASRAEAHFRFRHRRTADGDASTAFSDFPPGEPGRGEAIRRLAYAARTTSSFPAAFEPANPRVGPGVAGESVVDLAGICSETGAQDQPDGRVRLIDGGVLDNIPLSWAIRAVAGAPADSPVDRWLLYLDPIPPKSPGTVAAMSGGSMHRLVRTLKQVLLTKINSETVLDDAAELQDAWSSAQALRGAAGGLPGDPTFAELTEPARLRALLPRYRETVACLEADRLVRLLEDPVQLVGADPLPMPANPSPLDEGQDSVQLLSKLRGDAIPELATGAAVGGPAVPYVFRTPLAAARAVRLGMDWVRAVEATQPKGAVIGAAQVARRALYDSRFACEVLVAARDRLLLATVRGTDDPTSWVREATARLATLVPDGTLAGAWGTSLGEALGGAAGPVLVAGAGEPAAGWPQSVLTPVWNHVAGALRDFAGTPNLPPVAGFGALRTAADSDDGGIGDMLRALAAAELVLGPLRPDPLSEPTGIRFHTVSAAARSPLDPTFFAPDEPPASTDELVDKKLSGNQLMNFASFLSARWRLSDWTWGRLDAAASLVQVVARDDRLATVTADGLRSAAADLHDGLSAELGTLVEVLDGDQNGVAALLGPPGVGGQERPTETFRRLLTTRLHWNIVREELPVLRVLTSSKGVGDLPPDQATLDGAAGLPVAHADARLLGGTGSESVRYLFRNRHLSRASLRLALVAWRGLQPDGGRAAWLVRVVFGLVKPLVVPPFVIGFLAPVGSLGAAALAWAAIALGTGTAYSWQAHALVAVGAGYAAGAFRWHHKRRPNDGKARMGLIAVPAVVTTVVLLGLGWLFLDDVRWDLDAPVRVLAVFGAGAGAVWSSLWWMPAFGRPGSRNRFVLVALAGLAAGLVGAVPVAVGAAALDAVLDGWVAVLVLYGALAAQTVGLTRFYPDPPA